MNPLPGVHLVYGRYGQFRFDQTDRQVLHDGVLRTACRNCGQAVTAPRFKFYCAQTCRTAYWRDVVPPQWPDIRAQALRRDGHRCVLCGATGTSNGVVPTGTRLGGLEVDHIKPVAQYPDLELVLANVRTLCRPCHARHGWRPSGQALTIHLQPGQARLAVA